MTTPIKSLKKTAGPPDNASNQLVSGGLPLSYGDAALEYRAFYEGAAVYDEGRRGKIRAVGADVLDLLNRLSTNKVDHLVAGEGAPTVLTSDKGRIIDLVYVLNLGPFVLLLTGAGSQSRVMEWVDRYTIMEDSTLEDVTDSLALVSVAGPKACVALETVTGLKLDGLQACHSLRFETDGLGGWVVRMDLGVLSCFQVLVGDGMEGALLEKLLAWGTTPVGTEAWEAYRIGAGLPVYGKELDESRNPLEAGLIGAIDFDKGCYIGQEVIARLDTYEKVQRALVSLKIGECGQWEEGDYLILDGRRVGTITSLARAPSGGEVVGLGYVRLADATVGKRYCGEEASAAGSWVEVVGVPKLFGVR